MQNDSILCPGGAEEEDGAAVEFLIQVPLEAKSQIEIPPPACTAEELLGSYGWAIESTLDVSDQNTWPPMHPLVKVALWFGV